MTMEDPDLEELARVTFATDALRRHRDEMIRKIAARGSLADLGKLKALHHATGLPRWTLAAIVASPPAPVRPWPLTTPQRGVKSR
ncbi:hypothetical protein [Streptomyces noursei]